jgi:hypothetical protein
VFVFVLLYERYFFCRRSPRRPPHSVNAARPRRAGHLTPYADLVFYHFYSQNDIDGIDGMTDIVFYIGLNKFK